MSFSVMRDTSYARYDFCSYRKPTRPGFLFIFTFFQTLFFAIKRQTQPNRQKRRRNSFDILIFIVLAQ